MLKCFATFILFLPLSRLEGWKFSPHHVPMMGQANAKVGKMERLKEPRSHVTLNYSSSLPLDILLHVPNISYSDFFFNFIHLFMRGRERERKAETGRGRSRPSARSPMWDSILDPGITSWAEGRRSTVESPRRPSDFISNETKDSSNMTATKYIKIRGEILKAPFSIRR